MEKSKYEEIDEKLKGVKTIAEARERLTDEELVYYLLYDYDSECLKKGDERLISGIIRVIAEDEPSFRRSVELLDAAKAAGGIAVPSAAKD